MTGGFIEWARTVGAFIADPGPWVVATFTFALAPLITFLAVQTAKRQYFNATGKEYSPGRIQACSWAWYSIISATLQVLLYWGTPSQVPYHIAVASTFIGVICYVGTVEWWISFIKRNRPELWQQLRTRRRATDREEAEGVVRQLKSRDPDATNH